MEYAEISYEYVHQTDEAVLISDGDDEYWIPKSCIENINDVDLKLGETINIEEWFAIKIGLI